MPRVKTHKKMYPESNRAGDAPKFPKGFKGKTGAVATLKYLQEYCATRITKPAVYLIGGEEVLV